MLALADVLSPQLVASKFDFAVLDWVIGGTLKNWKDLIYFGFSKETCIS